MESSLTNQPCGRFRVGVGVGAVAGVGLFLQLLALTLTLSSTIHNAATVHAWVANVKAPSSVTRTLKARSPSSWRTTSLLFMSDEETESKEDEINKLEQELKIARLEAELAKLKEDKSPNEDGDDAPSKAAGPPPPLTAKYKPMEAVEEEDEEMLDEASMDMFMSEGWKDRTAGYNPKNTATVTRKTEEQNNLIGLAVKVVGALLAVILFSQIPVGQEDLSKYSAIKSGPARTSIDLGDMNRVKGQTGNYDNDL